MSTTDPARVAALKAQLAALSAELDELTAETPGTDSPDIGVVVHNEATGEPRQQPKPQTRKDALAAVRRRHGRTRSEIEVDKGTGSRVGDAPGSAQPLTGAAAGIAEARRRHGRR